MVTKAETARARMRALVERVTATHMRGTPYPREFRDEVMAYARERMADGAVLPHVAGEIGISYWTVWGWLRAKDAPSTASIEKPRASMVPVHVVATKHSPTRGAPLTIHGPCGLRIEGADVETIAALLRRLA